MKVATILDPGCAAWTPISDIATRNWTAPIQGDLCYFDYLVNLKEKVFSPRHYLPMDVARTPYPDRPNRMGRRLVLFSQEADQQILSANRKINSTSHTSGQTFAEACLESRDKFKEQENRDIEPNFLFLPERVLNHMGLEEQVTIQLKTDHILPLPDRKAPLDDVIRFSEKRADERDKFWDAIFSLADDVGWAEDPAHGLNRKVSKAIDEYRRVNEESWGGAVKQSIGVSIIPSQETVGILTAIAASFAHQTLQPEATLIESTVAGTALGSVVFWRRPGRKPLSAEAQAMAYTSSVKRL